MIAWSTPNSIVFETIRHCLCVPSLCYVGVLVLIGVAAAALWRQRRRQQQTAPTAPNTGKPSPGPAALACQHDIEASGDQGTKPDGPDAWSR